MSDKRLVIKEKKKVFMKKLVSYLELMESIILTPGTASGYINISWWVTHMVSAGIYEGKDFVDIDIMADNGLHLKARIEPKNSYCSVEVTHELFSITK